MRATGVRALAGAGLAAGLGAVHLPLPDVVCPLRLTTGVPCPACGTTTAMMHAGRLDIAGALAANPVAVVWLVVLVAAPLLAPRWRALAPAMRTAVVLFSGTVAWLWQLARLGVGVP